MHQHAHGRQHLEAMIRNQNLEGLLEQAETLHGHLCPFVGLGVKAGQYAMTVLNRQNTGMEEVVAIVECNNCFTDGIQAVTGCTFGNNALIFRDLGKNAVTVARREDGKAVRLVVRPDYRDNLMAKYPAAEPLFQKIVAERQGTPEELHRFHHIWGAIARRELQTPLEEQFHIQEKTITMPEYARIVNSLICDSCGEQIMATKSVEGNGRTLCRVCAGGRVYVLNGQGIGEE
ncbi:MAG: FmdE family protein [Thermodesulfobacteriota bacterium]